MGLFDGDLLEASAHKGKILLTPELFVDREYKRSAPIDTRWVEAEDDLKAGRVSKAYSNHSEFIADSTIVSQVFCRNATSGVRESPARPASVREAFGGGWQAPRGRGQEGTGWRG